MGEVLLPFIEENRLLEAIESKLPLLNENEQFRNKEFLPVLYAQLEVTSESVDH